MTKEEYLEALTDLMMNFFATIQKKGELNREDLKEALVSLDALATAYEEDELEEEPAVSGQVITIPAGASASSW
jgi:hypothetical protein